MNDACDSAPSFRPNPLPITAFALTNALGRTTEEVLDALFAGRTGLMPCRLPLPFPTFAGEVAGELDAVLPKAFDSRAARILARPLLELSGAIARAIERWGSRRVGLVLGTSTGGIAETEAAFEAFSRTGELPRDFDFERQHAFHGLVEFARQSTGIEGPAFALSTACSSSGKVFGSVTSKDISDALKDQFGIETDKKKIVVNNPIKMLGEYTVDAKLYQEVTGQVKVLVEAQ